MKKKILELVNDYSVTEGRINRLTEMLNSEKVKYYFFTAWGPEDDDEIEADESSSPDEVKRFKEFLKSEIVILKQKLKNIDQKIIKQFKEPS